MSTNGRTGPQHSTPAIVSLVMGIIGLIGLWIIGPIIALVFGNQSRDLAAREPERYSDELGRAGRVLGWIGLGIQGAGLLLAIVVAGIVLLAR